MKCIKRVDGLEIKRVDNDKAEKQVASGHWVFCSKDEWRKFNIVDNSSNSKSEQVYVKI